MDKRGGFPARVPESLSSPDRPASSGCTISSIRWARPCSASSSRNWLSRPWGSPRPPGAPSLQNYIVRGFFAGYQGLTNILAMLIQLFLVSRIFRCVGISGALLFLPLISLGGYGYASFGASLVFHEMDQVGGERDGLFADEHGPGGPFPDNETGREIQGPDGHRNVLCPGRGHAPGHRGLAGDDLSCFLHRTLCRDQCRRLVVIWILLTILVVREYQKIKAAESAT